jgi:drug/metabolite transporter (DMT)-like permease
MSSRTETPSVAALGDRPAVAAIGGALCIAFSAVLVRLAEVSPSTAAVFRCAYALPALAVLAVYERRRFGPRPARERTIALGAGVFFAADLVFWHHAIGDVGAGLATVLANTQVVFVAVIAWAVLDERPERAVLVAVPVVMAGVVLISGVFGAGAYGDDPALGVVFGLLTAVSYAGFLLVLRRGNRDVRRPAGPLFDATLSGAIVSLLAGLVLGDVNVLPSWPAHGWLILLALTSQVAGWLLISVSLPRLPAAMTSVLLTLQPAGSVLLGIVLLSEAPSTWQLAGVAVILCGMLVTTTGGRLSDREAVIPE